MTSLRILYRVKTYRPRTCRALRILTSVSPSYRTRSTGSRRRSNDGRSILAGTRPFTLKVLILLLLFLSCFSLSLSTSFFFLTIFYVSFIIDAYYTWKLAQSLAELLLLTCPPAFIRPQKFREEHALVSLFGDGMDDADPASNRCYIQLILTRFLFSLPSRLGVEFRAFFFIRENLSYMYTKAYCELIPPVMLL